MKTKLGQQISQPVLSIRAKVLEKDLPDHVENGYRKILLYMHELGVQPNGPPFLAYYNIDLENLGGDGTWDLEVGFTVPEILPDRGEIKPGVIPEGKTVSCLYKGAYPGLGKAYSELSGWLRKSEFQFLNISYEYFLNSPEDVPDEELLTRVILLIK